MSQINSQTLNQPRNLCCVHMTNSGIVGTIRTLKQYLQEFTTDYSCQEVAPYFKRLNLLGQDNNVLDVLLSNCTYFDQLVFRMEDDRLLENDNRLNQCLSCIGEQHNANSQHIPENNDGTKVCIKIWSLCKLLKTKYPQSVAVYLELTSSHDHENIYKTFNNISVDVYNKHKILLDGLNIIEEHTKSYFNHIYKNVKYSVIAVKKPNKYPVLSVSDYRSSQGILNTTHKLLRTTMGRGLSTSGIVFIDARGEVFKEYHKSRYIDDLYCANKNTIKKGGYDTLLKLILDNINVFSPENSSFTNFHVHSVLGHRKHNADQNNNAIFSTVFEYLDATRDFYYSILLYLYQYLYHNAYNGSDVVTSLNSTCNFDDNIRDKFKILCQTINYDLAFNPNFVLNGDLYKRGETIYFIKGFSLDNIPCLLALRSAISRIMDYYTISSIYDNIFALKSDTYSPDYHVILSGWSHSAFIFHSFLYSTNKLQLSRTDNQKIMYTYSTRTDNSYDACNITDMYYPKVPSIYNV